MGVMGCNRKGCQSILCTRYSKEYGYICSECFNELVGHFMVFDGEVDIKYFMDSPKPKAEIKLTESMCREFVGNEFREV